MADTIADRIVEQLSAAGVKRIYGIVGDSLNPLSDALRRNGKIEWIGVRHEEAGAFAAAAEAQLTGELAVCVGSSGPGNLHLINGLFDAHRSGAPVLAIASHIPSTEVGSGYFQETHPSFLFGECSHYCELVSSAKHTPIVLHGAMQSAISKRGVGVIVISGDIIGEKADDSLVFPPLYHTKPIIRPNDQELAKLAQILNEHKKVTIFGGAGCADAHDLVVHLAEKLQAPIGYAYRGKQYLEHDNPYAVGMTGLLGWGAAYQSMEQCDVLLLLGTDFPYRQFYPDHTKIVQIDIDPSRLGRRSKLDFGLCGDIRDTLTALLPLIKAKTSSRFVDSMRKQFNDARKKLNVYVEHGPEATPIRPEYVTASLDQQANADAIFTVDTGTPNIWSARYISGAAQRRIIGSFVHGSMANAMPHAIGAALAYPHRQVIALCGDGGFSMLMGDLLTIKRYNLPVKIIVFNNGELDFINIEMKVAGYPPWETELPNPNFALLAQSVGILGIRVEDPKQVQKAIREAFVHQGPVLLDMVVDKHALSLPPHIKSEMVEGFALSMTKQILDGDIEDVLTTIKQNIRLRP
jgi:pyruvate dehydrogenase (quinone)